MGRKGQKEKYIIENVNPTLLLIISCLNTKLYHYNLIERFNESQNLAAHGIQVVF